MADALAAVLSGDTETAAEYWVSDLAERYSCGSTSITAPQAPAAP
ncbi:hypothetical protein [Streptomyces xanthochromogenes]